MDTSARLEKALPQLFGSHDRWSAADYLHACADPRQMVLAYRLFFPQFESVEGEPVFGPLTEDQRQAVRAAAAASDKEERLASYRWVEIPYLFADRSLAEEHDQLLAELVAAAWHAALNQQFPNRAWAVEVVSPAVSGSVVGVAFRAEHNNSFKPTPLRGAA